MDACQPSFLYELSCPALVDCSIAGCQAYLPDGEVCACTRCAPGYSGSNCIEVRLAGSRQRAGP